MDTLDEPTLQAIEKRFAKGLSSGEILEVFAEAGLHLTEATLRKYVQVGLLPRSVRVGSKGKHMGSKGIYPVSVVRQILRIREMMADNYTIEQIKKDVFFIRSDVQMLESTLESIFATLKQVLSGHQGSVQARQVAREVTGAKALSEELLRRLIQIESRLTDTAQLRSVSVS